MKTDNRTNTIGKDLLKIKNPYPQEFLIQEGECPQVENGVFAG
jgi:hypothetical protein